MEPFVKTPMHCVECGVQSFSLKACSACGSLDGFVVDIEARQHCGAATARSLLLLALIASYCSGPKPELIEPEPEETSDPIERTYDPRDDFR